jgi:hypothetical protein
MFRWLIFVLSVRQSFEIIVLSMMKDFNKAIRINISHPAGKKRR